MYQAQNTQLPLKSGPTSHRCTQTRVPSSQEDAQPARLAWVVHSQPAAPGNTLPENLKNQYPSALQSWFSLAPRYFWGQKRFADQEYSLARYEAEPVTEMLYTGVGPPNGPHKASFMAPQLSNYLLEGWKRGEGPAPDKAYCTELCAQWAPGRNGCSLPTGCLSETRVSS